MEYSVEALPEADELERQVLLSRKDRGVRGRGQQVMVVVPLAAEHAEDRRVDAPAPPIELPALDLRRAEVAAVATPASTFEADSPGLRPRKLRSSRT